MNTFQLIILAFFLSVSISIFLTFALFLPLWIRSFTSGANIGMISLILIKLRKIDPNVIIDAKVMAVQSQLKDCKTNLMQMHYLAGGDVIKVVDAMVVAKNSDIELSWEKAAKLDLANEDIIETVRSEISA